MKQFALVLAMVLLIGCVTTPQFEVDTLVQSVRVGYTDVTDKKKLDGIESKDVTFSVDLPKGTKTVVCFVQISCPKGTPIQGVWWLNGKKLAATKFKADRDVLGRIGRFWYTLPMGLHVGEWQFDIFLAGEKVRSVKFTVQ